ncbi:MAG: AgmX/PglI C-terminal domain-containing protein [Kofleriaceae bacterium]
MKRLSLSLVALIACGGAPDTGTTTPAGGGAGGTTPAPTGPGGDVSFELPPATITGMVFEPEALGRPGMPLVEAKKKTTIEKQRQVFASTKDPVQKEAHAAILATMLYQKSKEDKANEQALWTEARQVLRDAATAAGPKNVDEITLRLLGSYELLLEDYAGAAKAWGELVAKAPKDKDVQYNRAWQVYALLKQLKNAEALAALNGEQPSEKFPELAYVTAWAKWRAGDGAGAWQAILAASKGWGGNAGREAIDRDLMLFAGRADVPFAEVAPGLLAAYNAKQAAQQYAVLSRLATSYQFAGRWADGVAAIDKAIVTMGPALAPEDLPVLRYTQADLAIRLDNPEVVAKYGKQVLELLPACTKCPEKSKQDLVGGVAIMARLFHVLYATADDVRYYKPANDLYIAAIPLIADAARRAEVNRDADALQKTFSSPQRVKSGTHDKGVISALLGRRNQEAQACYEAKLVSNPKLGGTVTLHLESDASGEIKGVSTEPKAGVEDMSAVAGCLADHARTWKLPKRGSQGGVTRITGTFSFSTAKK